MNDPYAVLGVSSSASEEEIKRAYRDLVKKYHPDNYANNPLADLAEAKMKEVNEAYDAIMKARPLQQSHADSGAPAHCPEQSGGGGTDPPEYPGQQRGVVLPYGQYRLPPGLDGRCPPEFLDRLQHGPQQHGVPSGHEQYGDAGPTGNLWRGRRYRQPLYHPVLPQLSVQFVQRLTAHGRKMRMRCLA